jgi:hypothetical protein
MRLISYGLGEYDTGKFRPVRNNNFVKPAGGLWASPVKARFGWRKWCQDESFGDLSSSFEFSIEGRVMVIDSLSDASQMPWLVSHGGSLTVPDFEKMVSQGVDAVYLTRRGELETRYSRPYNLYGWDCECVLVMNPACIRT